MKALTKGEEQLMQVLWKLGKGFLKDIVEAMPEPRPHPNTVATILKILVDKGFVGFEVQGRNNIYRAAISKAEYGKKSVNQLVKGYFEGSAAKLVSQLVGDNKLTINELEEISQQFRPSRKNTP